MNIKGHNNSRLSLLAGTHIHRSNVYLPLRKDLGNIHKHSNPVIGINLNFCGISLLISLALRLLPFCVNQTNPLITGEVNNIDAVCSVNGNSTASGNKSDNLISRNRTSAAGKTHSHIVDSLNDNSALGFFAFRSFCRHLLNAVQNRLIRYLFFLLLGLLIQHLVDDLALF